MLSGNSYLTPISTVPGLVSILCLSHNSVSQFAPFLPTAITTLSPYMSVNSTSSFTFSDFFVLTPFIFPFSIIMSSTIVLNLIFIPCSSKYFSILP